MKTISLLFTLIFSTSALAIVDMRNANFSNTWTDIEVPGSGYALRVNRTYNSKTLYEGMFGFGWCSDFETSIEVTAEGNVKLTECGAGQEVFFTPREFGAKEVDATIAKIIEKMKAAKKGDEKVWKRLTEEMKADSDLRAKFAISYKVSRPVKEGTEFFANGREIEKVVLSKGVYTRYLTDGSYMKFTSNGKLMNMFDKNGNYLKFEWDKDTLKEVIDNNGRKFSFKYYNNKKIKSISGPNGVDAEYEYSNLVDLAKVRNAWKNTYTYQYDDSHNLVKATYPDKEKTFIALTYDKANDWVTSFKDREGCTETYKYEAADKEPKMHYSSSVKKVCGKEVTNESKHEFWYANGSDGQPYLSKVASTVNGFSTEVTYHEAFGKPLTIQKGNERFSYDYYPNGQVKSKTSQFSRLTYRYDKESTKVSEVISESMDPKGKVVATQKTEFKYDNKGNLIFAANSSGMKVTMTYDAKGRIATITDQARKVVKIEYEEKFGKPSIVTRPGLGTIRVSYKASGDMDKVTSNEGPSVARQVASTFNNLLDVIAPATAEVFQ